MTQFDMRKASSGNAPNHLTSEDLQESMETLNGLTEDHHLRSDTWYPLEEIIGLLQNTVCTKATLV